MEKSMKVYLIESEQEIDNFKEKVSEGGFLRVAALSHLTRQAQGNEKAAIKVLNDYLKEKNK